ncbi:5'-nucleotidase C-terminal domain-containing protein [Bacillus sp. 31A1R]|uniref:5'-nucleotidase C-terminal domain-containing protein n=1 Tax=Robertmurraya mangrovi TaxID=3098077 RepID=A0ABU5IY24_9BACI|nr:5'-nucleotidase C-terminal domain-containing protein [Bacillus sp. 31A1R]MDZ5472021.1 5'-nucleotidase C-terminal domain-containing protein [Bacillus sp. 31A1R]
MRYFLTRKNKITSVLVLFTILFYSLFTPIFQFTAEASETQEGNIVDLKILHTNDLHAKIDHFAKIAAYIQSERSKASHSLYIDAGDIFSGNPVVDLQKGKPIVDLLNDMGLQAMAIGNHDFDYGQEEYVERQLQANFPWLGANIVVENPRVKEVPQPNPYTILEANGLKVGLVSVIETPPSTAPANVVGIKFNDPIQTLKQYEFLKNETDILIALTHVGYSEDREIAQAINFFDVIIGAHSHTALSAPAIVNGTPIVQTGGNAENVGNLNISYNTETKEVVSVNGFLQKVSLLEEADPAIQAKVDAYKEAMAPLLGEVIGTTTGLSRSGNRDTQLGNFWTDSIRYFTNADVALTNNGGIRDNIASGSLTVGDIYRVEPFANEIMKIEMTGQALKDVIDYSYNRRSSVDLQTSGLHYKILTNNTGKFVGSELTINGQPIDLAKKYIVAVGDYIGSGGSGYNFAGTVLEAKSGFMTESMIAFAKHETSLGKTISYNSNERIKIEVAANAPIEGTVIGSTSKGLSSANNKLGDSSLGNLYTDSVRSKTGADFGMLNNSSVEGNIAPGDIADKQIENLDAFKNEIVVVKTNVAKVKEILLTQAQFHNGSDLQVSGLHYELIKKDGKISDVKVTLPDGSPLDETKPYTVAYNDYMHGRAFYSLGTEVVAASNYGKVWESIVEYVKNHNGPIDYVEGSRIKITTDQVTQPNPLSTIAEARQLTTNKVVTVKGTVTTIPGAWGGKGFYLQDETGAAYIYQTTNDVNVGDVVEITGKTANFNGEFQISNVTKLVKVDTAPVPAAIVANPSKENEGQLITLEEVTIADLEKVNANGTFEFKAINKENEAILVRVDSRTGLVYDQFNFQNGDVINLSGISSQFKGVYQVKPRVDSDFTFIRPTVEYVVSTPSITDENGQTIQSLERKQNINLSTEIKNNWVDAKEVELVMELVDKHGRLVSEVKEVKSVEGRESITIGGSMKIPANQNGQRPTLTISLKVDGKLITDAVVVQ